MRGFIVLLFGSIGLLLASALSVPAYAQERRLAPEIVCCMHVHEATAVTSEQESTRQLQLQSMVATRIEETEAPVPRFYQRWRRVHGRWYRFTLRRGQGRAMVTTPETSWLSRRAA